MQERHGHASCSCLTKGIPEGYPGGVPSVVGMSKRRSADRVLERERTRQALRPRDRMSRRNIAIAFTRIVLVLPCCCCQMQHAHFTGLGR